MLVLDRFEGESITIGNITITVIRSGKRVRLGIDAPKEIPIHRTQQEKIVKPLIKINPVETSYCGGFLL